MDQSFNRTPRWSPDAISGSVPVTVAFNQPAVLGHEYGYIHEALEQAHLCGDGSFTKRCSRWIEAQLGVQRAFMTHSCTAALEMAAMLCGAGPGDEVIMPSFTFTSTANAVALRGATPVFVDIRPDTLNIDEQAIEAAITPRTRAIFVVHYAGVACEMDEIMAIAARHGLFVVEDAAQALLGEYRGRPLGSFGHMAALSFHASKNVISGEGGALIVNDPTLIGRAEILRDKGTNRGSFFRGEVDGYAWLDIGSSYLPSELVSAFLMAQLEQANALHAVRQRVWSRYHAAFAGLEARGRVERPNPPADCNHNAHLYYLLLADADVRTGAIRGLRDEGIEAPFHYVPLHSSPAGLRYGRASGALGMTDSIASRLIRLPLWHGIGEKQDLVIAAVERVLG